MFKKVMVVIDSDANHQVALDKALEFARVDEFELVLLSCDHTQYLVEGYYFDAPEVHKLRAEYIRSLGTAGRDRRAVARERARC